MKLSPHAWQLVYYPMIAHSSTYIRLYAFTTQLRHLITTNTGTGILTRFPLTSPFGYALGPD